MDGSASEPSATSQPDPRPVISSTSARRRPPVATGGGPLHADASILRASAAILDAIVASGLALLVASWLPVESSLVRWFAAALVFLAYYGLQEACWGRTLFKAVFGLRVVTEAGLRPSVGQVLVRTVLRLVEANPLVLGFVPGAVVILLTRANQRIGDRMAGTLVVRKQSTH
jgi:uncharacterized RDD family membrane protein YckC